MMRYLSSKYKIRKPIFPFKNSLLKGNTEFACIPQLTMIHVTLVQYYLRGGLFISTAVSLE